MRDCLPVSLDGGASFVHILGSKELSILWICRRVCSEPRTRVLVQELPLYQYDQHDDTVLIGPDHNHICYKDRCGFHSSSGRGTVKTTEMRKRVTVVTLFIISYCTTDGDLTEIRRFLGPGRRRGDQQGGVRLLDLGRPRRAYTLT